MMKMQKVSVLFCLVVFVCRTQDYLLSPHEPAKIQLEKTRPYSDNYLIEVNHKEYTPNWNTLFAHYHSSNPETIVTLEFSLVQKQNPQRVIELIKQCRFSGVEAQWCKINKKRINTQNELIRMQLDCLGSCNTSLMIGITRTEWDGSASPVVLGEKEDGPINPEKTVVLAKIIGWMLLTLLLVLGAIQIAVKVADHFQAKRPDRDAPYKPKPKPKQQKQEEEEEYQQEEQELYKED